MNPALTDVIGVLLFGAAAVGWLVALPLAVSVRLVREVFR